jgi:hypothetical protein
MMTAVAGDTGLLVLVISSFGSLVFVLVDRSVGMPPLTGIDYSRCSCIGDSLL